MKSGVINFTLVWVFLACAQPVTPSDSPVAGVYERTLPDGEVVHSLSASLNSRGESHVAWVSRSILESTDRLQFLSLGPDLAELSSYEARDEGVLTPCQVVTSGERTVLLAGPRAKYWEYSPEGRIAEGGPLVPETPGRLSTWCAILTEEGLILVVIDYQVVSYRDAVAGSGTESIVYSLHVKLNGDVEICPIATLPPSIYSPARPAVCSAPSGLFVAIASNEHRMIPGPAGRSVPGGGAEGRLHACEWSAGSRKWSELKPVGSRESLGLVNSVAACSVDGLPWVACDSAGVYLARRDRKGDWQLLAEVATHSVGWRDGAKDSKHVTLGSRSPGPLMAWSDARFRDSRERGRGELVVGLPWSDDAPLTSEMDVFSLMVDPEDSLATLRDAAPARWIGSGQRDVLLDLAGYDQRFLLVCSYRGDSLAGRQPETESRIQLFAIDCQ